ncbi:hypothetical protein G9A89_017270 [Geosiphon pyriformis]|nr:hypothetical protein G9A89_017270 [Geosiphon pyriformis]
MLLKSQKCLDVTSQQYAALLPSIKENKKKNENLKCSGRLPILSNCEKNLLVCKANEKRHAPLHKIVMRNKTAYDWGNVIFFDEMSVWKLGSNHDNQDFVEHNLNPIKNIWKLFNSVGNGINLIPLFSKRILSQCQALK